MIKVDHYSVARTNDIKQNEDRFGFYQSFAWLVAAGAIPCPKKIEGDSYLCPGEFSKEVSLNIQRVLMEGKDNIKKILESLDKRIKSFLMNRYYGLAPHVQRMKTPECSLVLCHKENGVLSYSLLNNAWLIVKTPTGKIHHIHDDRQSKLNKDQLKTIYAFRRNNLPEPLVDHHIEKMIERERLYRNSKSQKDAFFTYTGYSDSYADSIVGSCPFPKGSIAVIASDGAARYWTHFGMNMNDVFTMELKRIIDYVRMSECTDKECMTYPRLTVHDDATLVKFIPADL